MCVKRTILATSLGIDVKDLAKQQLDQYQQSTPERALKNAKEAFKKQGTISGSWIYMKPEEIEKNGLLYTAYRGGVSRNVEGEKRKYELYSDAATGDIIGSSQTV